MLLRHHFLAFDRKYISVETTQDGHQTHAIPQKQGNQFLQGILDEMNSILGKERMFGLLLRNTNTMTVRQTLVPGYLGPFWCFGSRDSKNIRIEDKTENKQKSNYVLLRASIVIKRRIKAQAITLGVRIASHNCYKILATYFSLIW